jgi:small subunit ribosomal protein S2
MVEKKVEVKEDKPVAKAKEKGEQGTSNKSEAKGEQGTSNKSEAKGEQGTSNKSEAKVKKPKTSDRTVLLRELKEKAAKLASGIKGVDTSDIKEEFEKKRELLIPLDDYVRTGIHLGTKVITPDMRKFVYRRRADSIGVLNTTLIDENIKKAVEIISKVEPAKIVLACKREAGWDAAKLFGEVTGAKVFTKTYPAGMMTNIELEGFYEPELVIVCDPWIDRNALGDAKKTNKQVVMLGDTNNFIKDADLVIPCNNKGAKSLGLVFYLLAKGYIENKKLDIEIPSMFSFTGEDLQVVREVEEAPRKMKRKVEEVVSA